MTILEKSKTMPAQSVAILVLGMHRSGTSMLSGALQQLGCRGPKTPLSPSDGNPKGYFESQLVMQVNDEILAAAGSSWNDWVALRPGWYRSPLFNEFRDRAREVVAAEYGKSSLIYLKDPRICRLLPFWQEVLEGMGYQVLCVHTHRNPADVASSLQRRSGNEVERSRGVLVWLRHLLEAEVQSRSLPRVFTSYTEILESWPQFASKAEAAFGFSWPALSQVSVQKINKLIDPTLRHHDTGAQTFLNNQFASELVKDCLRIFESWTTDGQKDEDRIALDRIRAQFDLCVPLFSEPMMILDREQRKAAQLSDADSALASLRSELTVSQQAMVAAQKETQTLRSELTASQQVMAAAQKETHILRSELTASQQVMVAAQKETQTLQSELTASQQVMAAAQKAHAREIAEVRHFFRSTLSWRISAPIRVYGNLKRRGPR